MYLLMFMFSSFRLCTCLCKKKEKNLNLFFYPLQTSYNVLTKGKSYRILLDIILVVYLSSTPFFR